MAAGSRHFSPPPRPQTGPTPWTRHCFGLGAWIARWGQQKVVSKKDLAEIPRFSRAQIEIPLPNEQARIEARPLFSQRLRVGDLRFSKLCQVLKIHANPITKHGDIDYEAICKLTDNFNNADMRNICTEARFLILLGLGSERLPFQAGMFAIRAERDYVVEEDFMKAHGLPI